MFFGKKDPKKDNSPKCKVNTLACYMSFEPNTKELCHKKNVQLNLEREHQWINKAQVIALIGFV
jgi:hypothetical protein